jgi:hypothetical protein
MMKKRNVAYSCLLTLAIWQGATPLFADSSSAKAAAPAVSYPAGYRSFTHVKSLLLKANHPLANPFAGLHHVYANPKGLSGLKSGKYDDGAVLVFDLLDPQDGSDATAEGKRKLVGVMQRDSKKFAATGGWGFEGFAGDSKSERLVKDGGASCYGCHQARAQQSFVFSEWRE